MYESKKIIKHIEFDHITLYVIQLLLQTGSRGETTIYRSGYENILYKVM